MIVSFYDENPIIDKTKKSIFLAGPTLRVTQKEFNTMESWRKEAVKILEELNFDGIVYVPEYSTKELAKNQKDLSVYFFEWEWEALHASSTVLFWVPRKFPEIPALTTNVEFGFYLGSGHKVVYGRPDTADRVRYLDKLYRKVLGLEPYNDLRKMLSSLV